MQQFLEKKSKGFTLIELLAVIVVLAVILLIAVPNVLGIITNSKEDAFRANLKTIINSVEYKLLSDKVAFESTSLEELAYEVTDENVSGDIRELKVEKLEDWRGGWSYDKETKIITLTRVTNGILMSTAYSTQTLKEYVVYKVGNVPPPIIN